MDYKKKREELYIGKKFGKLTIIKEVGLDKWKKPIVECKCDCGKDFTCLLGNIRFRNVHQCNSCRYMGMKGLGKGQAGLNILKIRYKSGAKVRGLEFKLSDSKFKELTSSNCFYCNEKPKLETRSNSKKYVNDGVLEYGNYVYNGIDRIDSSLGYSEDNCVPCCETCNRAKLEQSKEEFLDWVKKVYEFNYKENK